METLESETRKCSAESKMHLETVSKPRDLGFDNMKGILIYLVVVAHFLNMPDFPSVAGRCLYIFIYLFHMPAFIFISGYFTKNVSKARDTAVKEYLLPYFFLTVVSWLDIYWIHRRYCAELRLFTAPTGCWFLFVLFIYRLLLKDILKVKAIFPLSIGLGLVSGFSAEFSRKLCLGRIFCFLAFFLAGYYTDAKHIEKVRKIPKVVSIVLIGAVMVIAYYFAKTELVPMELFQCRTYYRQNHQLLDCGVRGLYYVVAFIMIGCLINLCTNKRTVWTKIGKNSLSVYMLHLFILRRIDLIIKGDEPMFQNPTSYLALIAVLAALVTWVFSRDFIEKMIRQLIHLQQKLFFKESSM